MKNEISIGSDFIWTLKSPRLKALSSNEFDVFFENYFEYVDGNVFIRGDVIYNDGEAFIIDIKR